MSTCARAREREREAKSAWPRLNRSYQCNAIFDQVGVFLFSCHGRLGLTRTGSLISALSASMNIVTRSWFSSFPPPLFPVRVETCVSLIFRSSTTLRLWTRGASTSKYCHGQSAVNCTCDGDARPNKHRLRRARNNYPGSYVVGRTHRS